MVSGFCCPIYKYEEFKKSFIVVRIVVKAK